MHELIQSEIQSDIISEKSLSLPAEVFRFRSVPFREIYPTYGIGITPDPFGRGAYNLQSISATRKKVVWFTRLVLVDPFDPSLAFKF